MALPCLWPCRACGPAVPVALPLLWLLYHHSPESPGSLWPVCLFHCFTGLHCPGCGGTRALYWLLHGDLSRSLRCNILLLLLAGSLLALWGFSSLARKPAFVFGVAGAEVLFFLLRNLPCFPFPLLSPREDSRLFLCLRRCAVGAFPEKSLTSNLKRKTLRHGKQCWTIKSALKKFLSWNSLYASHRISAKLFLYFMTEIGLFFSVLLIFP